MNQSEPHPTPLDLSALLALYLFWGGAYLANKLAIATIDPFIMLAIRLGSSGLLLFALLRLLGWTLPRGREVLGSWLVGQLLLVGGMGAVVYSQQWVSSSLAAVIVSTMPLWNAFFGRFLGRRTRAAEWAGMALGLVGVYLLAGEPDLKLDPRALLVFAGPVSWAFGSAISPRVPQAPGPMSSAIHMMGAGLSFAAIALLAGARWQTPSATSLAALAYLILLAGVVSYSAYLHLLSRPLRPALVTSFAYVNPLVALALGVGFAGERLTGAGMAGVVLIVLGVGLVVGGRRG
ncbi:EamA family transporter [Oceanithermus sp.]